MKLFLMIMMLSTIANSKTVGTIAVLFSEDGSLNRKVYQISAEKLKFYVGNKNISCESNVSTKTIFVTCLDAVSDVEYSVLTDCDKGETALQINTKKNKKTLPEITINARCKIIEEKI